MTNKSPLYSTLPPLILIVDDQSAILAALAESLNSRNFRTAVAQDGQQGLRSADLLQPDLVLLNIALPDMDGSDVCRFLKANPETRAIPVIFMLTPDNDDKLPAGFDAGGIDYLIKPLQIEDVIVRLNLRLKLHGLQQAKQQDTVLSKRRGQMETCNSECCEEVIERKRAEQQLFEQNGQLDFMSFVLNQLHEAIFLIDSRTGFRIRYVNEMACRSLDYSREELLNMTVADIDPVLDMAAMKTSMETDPQQRHQLYARFETVHRRKDGHVFPVEISTSELKYEGLSMSLCVARDISERKQAEEALRASEERMRLFFERQLVGMAITSPQKGWLQVNDKLCEMLGYTHEELAKLTWDDLTYPDDLPADMAQFERMLGGEIDSYAMEKRYLHKDGRILFIDLSVGCVRRDDRSVDYVLALLEDITERKLAFEVALRYQEIFENVTDGVFVLDVERDEENIPHFRFVEMNPAMVRMGKLYQGNVIGRYVEECVPKDAALKMNANYRRCLEAGKSINYEMELEYPGGIMMFDSVLIPMLDEKGSVYRIICVTRDISERKRMEAEVQNHLHFFESMDRVNRAIQGTNDLEAVMNDVLDIVLTIFDCDRAYLSYPCAPEADSWTVPLERTRPEYPGAHALGGVIAMDKDKSAALRILLDADGPVTYGPGNQYPLPKQVSEQFDFKSYMATAIYPKGDKPWAFGIQQCSRTRVWTADEKKLFREIGRRLGDGLSSLLAYRTLQASEQEYRTLAENAPYAIARYDLQGRTRYFNPILEKVLHITTAEASGKRPTECFSQDYYEDYEKTLLQVAASGEQIAFELQYPGADGLETGRISMAAERGPDGKIIGVLAMGFNITRQRQLEQELIRSEREFRSLAENLPDHIARYDLQARLIYANTGLQQFLGAVAQKLLGKTPKERHPEGYYDVYQAKIEHVLRTGQSDELEIITPDNGNGLQYYHIRIVAERGSDREIVSALAIGRDVTRKRQLEVELIRRERKFRTLVKNSPGFIGRFDTELRRTYVNQVYKEATKTSEGEVLGKTPLEYWRLTSPNAEEFCSILRRVMATRQQEQIEAHAVTTTGAVRYFTMHIVPEFDEDGKIDGVLTTGIEITDIKNAERLKVEVSKQAERQLREFSAHLQLVREEEKNSFAREIHDNLGGTLTALKMDINWLMDELSEIKEAASLLEHIESMSQLLDNAAIATRQVITDLRPTILDDFGLSAALEWQAEQFHKRTGIQCWVACDESDSYELDKTQTINLFRIFQESLTNIVRHSGASKVEVELQYENAAIVLTISDNGCGLPEEHIIAPTSYGILGMRERTEQLGGRINFYSPPGGGFNVTVMLPRPTDNKNEGEL